ncbi:MAG: hypothetical protein DRI90_24225, partial [Deltaproteobacteria bacterium]
TVREGNFSNWRDDLTWYHDGEAVGFIAPEANAGYDFIEVDEQRMQSWLVPYFDDFFWWQLQGMMFPSATARAALDALDEGREVPGLQRAKREDRRVREVSQLVSRFRVPEGSQCLVFPEERSVRCRYQAGGWRMEQALCGKYRAVWVQGLTEPGDERERAEWVAARLFRSPFELEVLGHHEGKTFGKEKGASTEMTALHTPRWWVDERGLVGFLFIESL